MTSTTLQNSDWTVRDLLTHFGPMLYRRIRSTPAPGTATEHDVLDIHAREDRLYELIDGVLLEKTVGIQEAYLTIELSSLLQEYVRQHELGFILGPDGMFRLSPGLVRIPDVAFIAWTQLPERRVAREPMADLAPSLAIEVLSPSDTEREIERKLHDYFTAGVRLVWYVDPVSRQVEVFTTVDQVELLHENDTLRGDPLLPGFTLSLASLFCRLG